MNRPLVSVVIPCFNVAKTVAETIASVTAQTMADFEILAVDNNCTDGTIDVLSEIATRERRLRIVKQPVQGLSAARNGGIAVARGKFIALLDADDLWDADYLQTHLSNLANEQVGISYSRIRMIDTASRPTGNITDPQINGLTAADLLRTNPCTSLFVARREVFDTAGLFNEHLRSIEDQEWLFRAALCGVRLQGIDRVLAGYRIMPGGLSSDLGNMLCCHGLMLDAAAKLAPELTARYARVARGGMLRYCARRAVEHGLGAAMGWRYLMQMAAAAPELVVLEPVVTLKAVARVLASTMRETIQVPIDRAKEI